jgi:beta-xylosidase
MIQFRILAVCAALLGATVLPAATAEQICVKNPMGYQSGADPCIVRFGRQLYMYSTGSPGDGAYYMFQSADSDRMHWKFIGNIFDGDKLPPWGPKNNSFWAPEVHKVGKQYVCYFCMRNNDHRFCIGTGTSTSPAGPFTPQPLPLASDPGFGLIDPTYFRDPASGRSYVIWKEDKNDLTPQQPTGLVMQELSPDGLKTTGSRHRLIQNDCPWEGVLVEAPSMIYRNGYYYLLFSGNAYVDDTYAVGVARSQNILGPYEKYPGNPILKSSKRYSGPGHQFLFEESPGRWTMFYHARDRLFIRNPSKRLLMSDPVLWGKDGWPLFSTRYPSESWCLTR